MDLTEPTAKHMVNGAKVKGDNRVAGSSPERNPSEHTAALLCGLDAEISAITQTHQRNQSLWNIRNERSFRDAIHKDFG